MSYYFLLNAGIGTGHININQDKREVVTISKDLVVTYQLSAKDGDKIKNKAADHKNAPTLLEMENNGGDITVKAR